MTITIDDTNCYNLFYACDCPTPTIMLNIAIVAGQDIDPCPTCGVDPLVYPISSELHEQDIRKTRQRD